MTEQTKVAVVFSAREALAALALLSAARYDKGDGRPELTSAEEKLAEAIRLVQDKSKKYECDACHYECEGVLTGSSKCPRCFDRGHAGFLREVAS